jgi:hypothetical protein
MWNKPLDLALRVALVISVAGFDIAPALAALPVASRPADAGSIPDIADIAPLILAQSVDHPHNPDPGHDPGGNGGQNIGGRGEERDVRLSQVITRRIVLDLASVRKECSNYDEVYRIDCLRQGIDMIVGTLPDNSEYRDVKRVLRQASARLARIVSTYEDTAAPRLDAPANANPRFKRRRHYVAIRREAAPEAMAKATRVIEEATTELLRSGENSERRYAHYQQISVAVDSTKILLRSS